MLKLKLNQTLKNLAGEPIKDGEGKEVMLGKVMANAIISVSNTTDPTKNYLLATRMYQEEEITFTAEDLEYVKKQIKEAGSAGGAVFPVLYKGQILNILSKVDKEDEQENKAKQDKA